MAAPLTGRTIWLTRPAHQAEPWARLLESAGARVIREPLIEIEAPADPEAARAGLARADDADVVVASSVNAVAWAWRLSPGFAPSGALYGVGPASARALAEASDRDVAQPAQASTSEALLRLEALADLRGQRVALLAGEGGRSVLADTLAARGGAVEKTALYRRRGCDIPHQRLSVIVAHSDALVVTGGEALCRLFTLPAMRRHANLRAQLARCLLVAPSERVVQLAQTKLRWTQSPLALGRVSGEAVVDVLARCWRADGQ